MTKGIIYIMTSAVSGLIKIGKTGIGQFETRMNHLEKNGYANVAGLKRKFAIAVNDYDEKEQLLHQIFNKSRVADTELFALDVDLVILLLSSFDGQQIYPENQTKDATFEEAAEATSRKAFAHLPEREYHLKRRIKRFDGCVEGRAVVKNGTFTVLKGSICAPLAPSFASKAPAICQTARIENNVLMEDVVCSSPSSAAALVIGNAADGWREWKDANNQPIDTYRDN